jgi:hypothetical protein
VGVLEVEREEWRREGGEKVKEKSEEESRVERCR